MIKSYVYAKLPRGGLGNKMLVWARALVFAKKNNLPLLVSKWAEIKIGPYIRNEKIKRQYWGYFKIKNHISIFRKILFFFLYKKIYEHSLDKISINRKHVYIYNKLPDWSDYFAGLRGFEDYIKQSFYSILSNKYKSLLSKQSLPVIAVHVRQSDFRPLRRGEIRGLNVNVRTPIEYFIKNIEIIRAEAGCVLPVTIFTDGKEKDIEKILALPNVKLAEPNDDIVDLYLISKAKCIVVSAGSTFSYWAAFLSEAIVITDFAHNTKIRSAKYRENFFEGHLHDDPTLNRSFNKKIKENM